MNKDIILRVRLIINPDNLKDKGMTEEQLLESLVDQMYDNELVEHASRLQYLNKEEN